MSFWFGKQSDLLLIEINIVGFVYKLQQFIINHLMNIMND